MEPGAIQQTPNPAAAPPSPAPIPGVGGGASPSPTPAVQPAFTPAAPVAAAPPAPPSPTRATLDGEGDNIPEAEVLEMSKTALKKRLERYSKTQLKQLFGTDNPEEVMAWKQQAEEYKAREEANRLAQMTEAERYRAMQEKSAQEASHWRGQFEQLQEQHMLREQDRQVMSIAAKHVKPKCLDFVTMQLAQHLHTVEEEDMRDPQAYIDSWVKNYVTENPEFGTSAMAPPAPPAGAPGVPGLPPGVHSVSIPGQGGTPAANPNGTPRQVPVHNGPTSGRPQNAIPAGTLAQKTAAPGLPNSMSDDEWRTHKRSLGYNF